MSADYFVEVDPFTGETSSFGGIAEAAAEYHARGELCPWDCARCDPASYEYDEDPLTALSEEALARLERDTAEQAVLRAWPENGAYEPVGAAVEPPF